MLNITDLNMLYIDEITDQKISFKYKKTFYELRIIKGEWETYNVCLFYKSQDDFQIISSLKWEQTNTVQSEFIRFTDKDSLLIDKGYFVKKLIWYELCNGLYNDEIINLRSKIHYQKSMIKTLEEQIKLRKLQIIKLKMEVEK